MRKAEATLSLSLTYTDTHHGRCSSNVDLDERIVEAAAKQHSSGAPGQAARYSLCRRRHFGHSHRAAIAAITIAGGGGVDNVAEHGVAARRQVAALVAGKGQACHSRLAVAIVREDGAVGAAGGAHVKHVDGAGDGAHGDHGVVDGECQAGGGGGGFGAGHEHGARARVAGAHVPQQSAVAERARGQQCRVRGRGGHASDGVRVRAHVLDRLPAGQVPANDATVGTSSQDVAGRR